MDPHNNILTDYAKESNTLVNNDKKEFENFLLLKKNLSELTIRDYLRQLNVLERTVKKPACKITDRDIQAFLLKIKQTKSPKTYNNYLCMLKAYFRDFLKKDYLNDFKHPNTQVRPKTLPSKQELRTFYEALPSVQYRIIFLALASSGLRISELLTARIDRKNRMLTPQGHEGKNKQAWCSFYNGETETLLKEYQGNPFDLDRNTVAHFFKATADKTGIEITPQTLRAVFAREMSLKGVQDRFVDAFCGRVPGSVLAKHYTEYSPEALKEIYEKANLRVLEYREQTIK